MSTESETLVSEQEQDVAKDRGGEQYVYFFGEGHAEGRGDMKDVLGGKGAGLAEMTNAGVPVPPGFTISTSVCRFYHAHAHGLPEAFAAQQDEALARLERTLSKTLGEASDPLLVSVRSGAKFSMPGMMDTILNLGLNDRSVRGLAEKTGNARFAWAREPSEPDGQIHRCIGDRHARHESTHVAELVFAHHRLYRRLRARRRAPRDLTLFFGARVLDVDLEQEAIELRFGQRVRPLLLDRIARREHLERIR